MTFQQVNLSAKILIVDDLEANVLLLSRMLAEEGYTQITSTTVSTEVCSLHRRHDYDLILLDLQMPGMDGFAVMDGLRAAKPERALPVIVITAQPGHKLRALQSGARDFISRPFDVVELKTRVRNTLEMQLLHRKLEEHNRVLEQTVSDRTADLRASEARFRNLTELASDSYWEQDERGEFTLASGPIAPLLATLATPLYGNARLAVDERLDEVECQTLRAKIAAREPFLDFVLHCISPAGSAPRFRVSGQPIFDQECRFRGYRGVGVELLPNPRELTKASNAIP